MTILTYCTFHCYELLQPFSRGPFGVVHRCVERATGNVFAAKFVNTPHALDKDTVRAEINILNQLRHPKLLNLHDAFDNGDEMVLIHELLVSSVHFFLGQFLLNVISIFQCGWRRAV